VTTMKNKHPIYIISKGRWETNMTADSLEEMGVSYYMVVELEEVTSYALFKRPNCTILKLPKRYLQTYDTVDHDDNRGRSTGPGAARNFCWDHSIDSGYSWHWVMDDNINGFYRFNNNRKIKMASGGGLRACEDWVGRYDNIGIAGLNYEMFCPRHRAVPPFFLNTRIYSCLLIRNGLPYRWRGRYNEDTDLSLRALKDGWVTVQFNAFLANKIQTQTQKGGNTAEFYEKEGTINKSELLVKMHPDVARVTWKFSRWHHHVDYRPFKKNKLHRDTTVQIKKGVDNYGMVLEKRRYAKEV